MARRAGRDMEASCDSLVVAGGDTAFRRAYGELLLETAAGERKIPLSTRFGGGKKLMKERLYDLFHPGKRSRVLVGAVLLLCLLAGSPVPDGVYCAPEPAPVKDGEDYDSERWTFTLAEYDPESGVRGEVLGTYTLPLAEKLLLQRAPEVDPTDAGEVGSEGRRRNIVNTIGWPLLCSQYYVGMTDLLEVRVQDGAVTSLRWFQLPGTEAGGGVDPIGV